MTTLLQLRTAARQLANMENSQFVTDAELNTYVNWEAAELYGILATSFEAWNVKGPVQFTVSGSNNTIPLPGDFWMLHGLDTSVGGTWSKVTSFMWPERDLGNTNAVAVNIAGGPAVQYSVQGYDSIYLVPELFAANTYRYWYIPEYADMVSDSDTIDDAGDPGHWEQYAVIGAAIAMLTKAGRDASYLVGKKQQLKQRIELESKGRDEESPKVAVNVRRGAYDYLDFSYGPYGY